MSATGEPVPGAHRRTRRRALAGVGLSFLLLLQWLLIAIPTIDAEKFDYWAVEVERSSGWRYGYVAGRHGAFPVKAPLGADAAPFVPPKGDPLSALIVRHMKTAPWKAGLEFGFYVGLFALNRYGLLRLPWARAAAQHRVRWSCGIALSSVILLTAAMAPYLATGYGESLFSTRRGLGALSYSHLLPITAPVAPAVSYGLLLQSVMIWPLMATEWVAGPLWDVLGIRSSLWLVTASFWGLVAAAGAWFAYPPTPAGKRE